MTNTLFENFENNKASTFEYSPIVAAAHMPPYKIHKYFMRRPYNVFEQLVQNFTAKDETILDPFCGGLRYKLASMYDDIQGMELYKQTQLLFRQ
jgi:DNA modification methylase